MAVVPRTHLTLRPQDARERERTSEVVAAASYGTVIVLGALTLYLDFINMFQFLLSFLGNRN